MALINLSLGPRHAGPIAPVSVVMPTGCRATAPSRRAGKADMSRLAFVSLVLAWAGTLGLVLVLALAIRWLA
jgi:hypothetical protein